MLKRLFIIALFCYLSCEALAQPQRFSGTVRDTAGIALSNASVLLKYTLNNEDKVLYALSDSAGRFSFTFTAAFTHPVLEITMLGFKKHVAPINLYKDEVEIRLSAAGSLLPSVVVTNNFGIRVNGDTTTFSISRFSNKNEQSVEDLLKKIPGFDVDNDGNIKFNGRLIEKVLIEGDDLYGSDFKMLTRNLSPDAVEQVQAIDNYNDNPLLKGLVNTNKQVLNLKLKKKVLLSGNTDLGGGVPGGKYDNRINLLSITPAAKITVLGNMNNIGVSPFSFTASDKPDPVSMSRSFETTAEKITPIAASAELNYQGIDAKRSNINNAKIINAGFLVRPVKDLSIKGGMYLIGEKTIQQQWRDITYLTNTPAVHFTESTALNKQQSFSAARLEMSYMRRNKQLFEYDFKYERGSIDHRADMLLSSGNLFTTLATDKIHVENRFHYTNRFSSNTALDAEILYNRNKVPQHLYITPLTYAAEIGFHPDTIHSLRQESNFPLQQLSVNTHLAGAANNWNYTLNLGYNHFNRDFNTGIYGIDSTGNALPAGKPYMTDYLMRDQSIFTTLSLRYKTGNIKFDGSSTLTKGKYEWAVTASNYTLFKHRFTTSYQFKKGGALNAIYTWQRELPAAFDLVPAWWMAGYRNLRKGASQFSPATGHIFSLNYALSDFFKRQLLAYCGVVYTIKGERYIEDILSTARYQKTETIPYAFTNRYFIAYARLEKYIRPFSGNLILDVNSTWGNYLNRSNAIDNYIRFNTSDIKLGFKSVWTGVNILVQSNLKLRRQTMNSNQFKKTNNNLYQENRVSLYYMPGQRLNVECKAEYYVMPNGNTHQSYLFLDFNVQYALIKDKLVLNGIGSNLSNVHALTFNTITPTQVSTQRYNLLERYFMIKVHYAF
ncbi:carboxypeptidase regulatory-like domain-containing protein [Pseudoflavitalea sp. X16]|uniref:carboxypeptidase-like regulatory domain-containing protein n=1 Tax=Paraflavitalea devenefica TaxID=2716334 RepID=UPI00141FE78F|nr:carboxypeptidase-like regulatory domain-containing protein [Paraflavitalea devenefica]NII28826.1 carboxypeptidase regulatory-like domain-containing protein [Paraflavitalea devenefica]